MQIKPDNPLLAALARHAESRLTPPARPAQPPAQAREAARAFFAVAQQPLAGPAAPVDPARVPPRGSKLNIVV